MESVPQAAASLLGGLIVATQGMSLACLCPFAAARDRISASQRRKDLVGDLFSKSVTLERLRTNWNIDAVMMDKNLKREQGGARGSGLSQIEELANLRGESAGAWLGRPMSIGSRRSGA
jgi:hypothetical protein